MITLKNALYTDVLGNYKITTKKGEVAILSRIGYDTHKLHHNNILIANSYPSLWQECKRMTFLKIAPDNEETIIRWIGEIQEIELLEI